MSRNFETIHERIHLRGLAGSFERSADWLDHGSLHGPPRKFPLAGTADYRLAAAALRAYSDVVSAPSKRDRTIEAAAALCGLLGAFLLALKGDHAGWGWVAFLASNAGWIAFGWIRGHRWLVLQQVGFTASSLLGISRWLL